MLSFNVGSKLSKYWALSLFWVAESFRFEDENEYDIKLKVFARVLEKRHPRKLHFTFVIYAEKDKALFR